MASYGPIDLFTQYGGSRHIFLRTKSAGAYISMHTGDVERLLIEDAQSTFKHDLWTDADARVGGGLYVGSTAVDPASDNIYADGDIRAGDSLIAGSTTIDSGETIQAHIDGVHLRLGTTLPVYSYTGGGSTAICLNTYYTGSNWVAGAGSVSAAGTLLFAVPEAGTFHILMGDTKSPAGQGIYASGWRQFLTGDFTGRVRIGGGYGGPTYSGVEIGDHARLQGYLDVGQISEPVSPASGDVRFYADANDYAYVKDDTGVIRDVGRRYRGFKAYNASDLVVPTTWTNFVGSVEDQDTENALDTGGTGRFTVPAGLSGYWRLTFVI
jgi:hypothetical protein